MKKIEDSLTLQMLVDEDDDKEFNRLVKALEDLTDYIYFSTSCTKRLKIAVKLIRLLERQRTSFWFFQPSFSEALRAAAKKLWAQLDAQINNWSLFMTENEKSKEAKKEFLSDIDKIISKYYPE
ncbi:MAG: hypothetical protein WA087_03850 [Candidatus Saccharimonadales bacterium]